MTRSLGFSPCPNDTFIFDAWVNGQLPSIPMSVKTALADVETLNEWANESRLDITKLSFPALFRNRNSYRLLPAGSALGQGVGPLLIAREPISANDPAMAQKRVLLPGRMTTANLLFSYAYPEVTQKTYRVFSEIEAALLNGEADLGVIIHENRFTYAQRGLHLVNDLGTYWETKTACAIPLGCIAIKRSLGETEAQLATEAIQESLDQAWKQMPRISAYVREHAQAMDPSVLLQHIELYVNDHTRALTPSDLQAIETLYQVYCRIEGIKPTESGSFF